MYNKLTKKFYLFKLFSFSLPVSVNLRKSNYYLCKYFIKNTPYGNISNFIKELQKILFININSFWRKKLIFFCTTKMFLKTININNKKNKINQISKKKNKLKPSNKSISFYILFGDIYTSRQIAFLKNAKIPSIGFINFNNVANFTDYTLLLQNKYFTSVFLVNYVLKKLTYNVPY